MEGFKRHLMKDWVVVPRQKYKPEKSEHKETGKNENAVDESFFRRQVHENCRDQSRFKHCHQHGHRDVRLRRAKVHVGKRDGNGGERKQRRPDHQITSDVLLHVVRVLLVLAWVLRNIRRVVHQLEQIKKWKNENPDQIDKVPEKADYLDAICQMFRVALVKLFAD